MLLLRRTNKLVTLAMLLSLALAFVLDAVMSMQPGNADSGGKTATLTANSSQRQVIEAGVIDWFKKIGRAFVFVYNCGKCLLSTAPLEWGECPCNPLS